MVATDGTFQRMAGADGELNHLIVFDAGGGAALIILVMTVGEDAGAGPSWALVILLTPAGGGAYIRGDACEMPGTADIDCDAYGEICLETMRGD